MLDSGNLKVSSNLWDWLGDGIYFWEDSLDRAIVWAERLHPGEAAVIETRVRLGRCLDLFDTKWVPALKAAYEDLASVCKRKGQILPVNHGGNHGLDRAVINNICENSYDFDTVRGPFLEGSAIFPGSMLPNLIHVQIAVRNARMIIGPLKMVYPFQSKTLEIRN